MTDRRNRKQDRLKREADRLVHEKEEEERRAVQRI